MCPDPKTTAGKLALGEAPVPRLLSNGRLAVRITTAGTGYTSFIDYMLTAWRGDPIEDADGFYIYMRDLETGAVWSLGLQPTRRRPERYAARSTPGVFELEREDFLIEARVEIAVHPDRDLELRRVTLRNRSGLPRRIELTTYAEVVLAEFASHASHPAFSKLFVQTEFVPGAGALLARRRPRGKGEEPPWLVHGLVDAPVSEHETDRARFLGRGRRLDAPLALATAEPLSGTTGNVLDPIVCLRTVVDLPAGATAVRTFVLGAAATRQASLDLVTPLAVPGAVDAAFAAARAHANPDAVASEVEELDTVWAGVASSKPAAPLAVDANRPRAQEELAAFNGYGGFTPDGRAYVLRLERDAATGTLQLPPRPWTNVIANERFGAIVSETGAGCTWSENSREHRLTPWSNDPVTDPHGEVLYVRDEETMQFWSALPGPVPRAAAYEVRHGFGSSRFKHTTDGLEHEVEIFVPRHDTVKLTRLRIRNRSGRRRRLAAFSYAQLASSAYVDPKRDIETELESTTRTLWIRDHGSEDFASRMAFAAVVAPQEHQAVSATADRAAFLGRFGTVADPAALRDRAPLDGTAGRGLDPCAAHQVLFDLEPEASVEITFLLGEAADVVLGRALLARYRHPDAIGAALAGVRRFWHDLADAVQIRTPMPALDLMVNGWLTYQVLACRIWARSAAYQSGGAFGFRDQLQDAAALVYAAPERARAQIVLHAGHQFVEGDVLHWWHPPVGRGIRTRFADDLLWLPYLTAFYVHTTGDSSVLDELAPYLTARELAPGEDEAFLLPEPSGTEGTVYEHCCRALDRSLTRGAHGLPLFGTGDWNDGMNRVGREGRGESVWMGFFLETVFRDFMPLCVARHDSGRLERYGSYRKALGTALQTAGWDGEWYRRGYYDDGNPLGTKDDDECRIDALVQAWSVLSGAAPPDRAALAMNAVERDLVSEADGLIRLLWPAFDRTVHDPGYIKGYVPGVRENGGQYTHAALWVVRALAELGRNDRAARLLEMLSPVNRAATRQAVDRYEVEPYVVAADVYGVAPHVGRGGWTWYTGSAGWMLRVALESVLGLTVAEGSTLVLAPCVPDTWPEFTIAYRIPGSDTRYDIRAVNAQRNGRGVESFSVDGRPGTVVNGAARIAISDDGRVHRVDIKLGRTGERS